MRYLLLVSHGTFAPGLHSVLDMLVGKREDILSCSLRDGEGADEYVAELEKVVEKIAEDDEVIVMGDIIGGSPLTNALDLQTDDPMALCEQALSEGQAAMREVELDLGEDNEDEDL